MPRYRHALPQLDEGALFLTDGGLETVLIFNEGIELPHSAACELLRSDVGRDVLRSYYNKHAALAQTLGVGFSLGTATWRANPHWTDLLGYDRAEFERVNRRAVTLAEKVRRVWETDATPIVIAAEVGPRGDGYRLADRMTAGEAEEYHAEQIGVLADTEADFVSALTIGYSAEAIGLARAARSAGIPITISFTVETDGRLPSGESLADAINAVDGATDSYPEYYMLNCAHPTHLPPDLGVDAGTRRRLRGYRANASRRTHAELDESDTLDDGDPEELAGQVCELRDRLPGLCVVGGCCGTDARHVEAIGRRLLA